MVDKTLAGTGTLGSFTPEQLFAGERDIVTTRRPFAAGQVFAQFEAVGLDATGTVVKLADATGEAHFVTVHAMDTSATGYNDVADGPLYEQAIFNHEMIVWPDDVDSLAERQAMFARGNPKISVERVL